MSTNLDLQPQGSTHWSGLGKPPKRPSGVLGVTRRGAVLMLLGALGYTLLLQLSVVRGRSMAPGIQDGDRILVEPWLTALSQPQRGDVVVLRSPSEPGLDYIKRVIGLPGEEVLVIGESVWVDGKRLEEPYAIPDYLGAQHWARVPAGHYYVLGDNRPRSSDSREFGLVPAEDIKGRVRLRLWPFERAGALD